MIDVIITYGLAIGCALLVNVALSLSVLIVLMRK